MPGGQARDFSVSLGHEDGDELLIAQVTQIHFKGSGQRSQQFGSSYALCKRLAQPLG